MRRVGPQPSINFKRLPPIKVVLALQMREDGVFELEYEDGLLAGRIVAVATADDVVKASALGQLFVAADVFLPEAVEEAKKRGVRLIHLDDLVRPAARLLAKFLIDRRADLLVKFFESVLPKSVGRSFSYGEYTPDDKGVPYEVKFDVKVVVPIRQSQVVEPLHQLMSKLSAALGNEDNILAGFSYSKSEYYHYIDLTISTRRRYV